MWRPRVLSPLLHFGVHVSSLHSISFPGASSPIAGPLSIHSQSVQSHLPPISPVAPPQNGVIGLPFQSGLSAGGDPRELCFDLSTTFTFGPALCLSYRPNDTSLPFALSVQAGLSALGSPAHAPFSLVDKFNLLSTSFGLPAFFLLLKLRLRDFSFSHTLRSSSPPRKVWEVSDGDGDGHEHELSYKAFSFSGHGLTADVAAAGRSGGVGALLSRMRLTTRSVLSLWGRVSLQFNWGLRAPPEMQAALADDRNDAHVPICKMPLLVMNKISIEQSPCADADKKGGKTQTSVPVIVAADASDGVGHGGSEGFSLVRWQLEVLNAESRMLHRAVEDLRAEIGSGKAASMAAGGEAKRNGGRVWLKKKHVDATSTK